MVVAVAEPENAEVELVPMIAPWELRPEELR